MERELGENELLGWCEELTADFSEKQILLLQGPVGVGKTHFVKALLESLGFDEAHSPTFSLINHYHSKKISQIYHVDLYRLNGDEDLESTGFWDLFGHEKALVLIEWPERMNVDLLPMDWKISTLQISFTFNEKRGYQLLNGSNSAA